MTWSPPRIPLSSLPSFRRIKSLADDFRRRWSRSLLLKLRPDVSRRLSIRRIEGGVRAWTPAMTEAQARQLGTQVRELHERWRTQGAPQVHDHDEEDHEGYEPVEEGDGIVKFEDASIEELANISIKLGGKGKKLKFRPKTSLKKMQSSWGRLRDFGSTVVLVSTQLPFYVATKVQGFVLKRDERENRLKKILHKVGLADDRDDDFVKLDDAEKMVHEGAHVPYWKRMIGPHRLSKTVVDDHTRFCLRGLMDTAENDSRCLRRLEMLCAHLHQYPYAKGQAVREDAIPSLLVIRQRTTNASVQIQVNEALALLGYNDPLPTRGIRVLSLDGGGMKGIVSLEVLGAIERTTGKKIHQLFDFICGVSTGAIIGGFLAFHKMSVQEVEELYVELGDEIFEQSLFRGYHGFLTTHSFYDTARFERLLKDRVGGTRMMDTVRTPGTPKLAAISTLVSGQRIMPYIFRNYQYPYRTQSFYRGSARHKIWEAARASSAAPGYFDEFVLSNKIYHDGAIICNNAATVAIHEAKKLWPNEAFQCVVSCGTGVHEQPISLEEEEDDWMAGLVMHDFGAGVGDHHLVPVTPPKALTLVQKFNRIVEAATDTQMAHITLRDLLPSNVYFRFNPPLTENYLMEDHRPEKVEAMRADTRMYLRRNGARVAQACDALLRPRAPFDFLADCLKHAEMVGIGRNRFHSHQRTDFRH